MAIGDNTFGATDPRRKNQGFADNIADFMATDPFGDTVEQEVPMPNMQENPFRFTQHEINPQAQGASGVATRTARARSPMLARLTQPQQQNVPIHGPSGLPMTTIGQIPEGLTGVHGMTPQEAVDYWKETSAGMSDKEIKGLGDMMDINAFDTKMIGEALGLSEGEIEAALAEQDFQAIGGDVRGGKSGQTVQEASAYDAARAGLTEEQQLLRGLGSLTPTDNLDLNLTGNWDLYNLMKMGGTSELGAAGGSNQLYEQNLSVENQMTSLMEQDKARFEEGSKGDAIYSAPGSTAPGSAEGSAMQGAMESMMGSMNNLDQIRQQATAEDLFAGMGESQTERLKKSEADDSLLGKIMKGIGMAMAATIGTVMTAGFATSGAVAGLGAIGGGLAGAGFGATVGGLANTLQAGIMGNDDLWGNFAMGAAGGAIGGGLGGMTGAGQAGTVAGGVQMPSPGQTFGGIIGKSATSATYGSNTAAQAAAAGASAGASAGAGASAYDALGGTKGITQTTLDQGTKIYGQSVAPNVQPGEFVDPAMSPTQLSNTFSPAMKLASGIRPGIFGTNPYYTPGVDLESGQSAVVG